MAGRARNELYFMAGFLLPLTLYVGGGAALVFGGYWLVQPTVIENSSPAANRAPTSVAYERPARSPPPIQESEPLRSQEPEPLRSVAQTNPINSKKNRELNMAETVKSRPPAENKKKPTKKVLKVERSPREQWVERRDEHPFWGSRASQTNSSSF